MRTDEELKKLASLERMSIECLDTFIDRRIQRGDSDGVPLRSFKGHVSHYYDLRDYIGRSENQLFDFFFARPYLWRMKTDGLIRKASTRLLLLESAVYINDHPKKRGGIHGIVEVLRTKWPTESWTSDMVETALNAYPELFKAVDESGWIFECRVSTVDDVILPECLFSPDNARRIDGILNMGDDDRYSSSTNSASAASYGGDHRSAAKYGGERPYSCSGAAAAVPPTTGGYRGDTARDTIEGIGQVGRVNKDFATAFVNNNRVHCHISTFEEMFKEPLTDHVCVGDELLITETVVVRSGPHAGTWTAKRVSTKKSPPEHDHRARDRSDATDRRRGTSGNRGVSPGHRRRSNSPPIASSTKPKRSATNAVNGAGATSYSAAAQGTVRSVHDRAESMIKKEEEKIRLVDVGVQTEVTDDELLLRVLRRFPQLLDGLNMAARQ